MQFNDNFFLCRKLSIASQQYGSRVLRNFMRDRITQVLLGIFVSTFIYSVLVVRAIRGLDYSGGFVPAISVTGAIVLSVISLVMLIFFVHHISASIQASRIVNVVSQDLQSEIVKLYPLHTGDALQDNRELEQMRNPIPVCRFALQSGGYLQGIDLDSLLK